MDPLKTEVDRNYDWFQRNLSGFLDEHRDQYALLKSQQLVEFFDAPGEAYRQGLARYADRIFSIQQVTDEPVELGFMSIAIA